MPNDGSVVIGTELDESGFRSGIKGLSGIAKAGGLAVGAAIGAAVGATAAFAKAAVDAGSKFDSSMSQVAATMGTTVDQIGDLRQYAIDMGATTAFSASQAADALNYMALAGYSAEESMQALPNVLNLAAAGNIALASASDMVTDAQSALGLSFDETAQLVDKMAKASSKSNTSVAQLGDAILTVGGTAKNLAGGTTELATVLGILADNGIKGAEGGTALRNIILSLSAPTDKAAKRMKQLGLDVFDAEGKMRPMEEIMNDLNGVLSDMTQGEQTQVLNEIFNKVDLKSVNALLATNVKRWGELSGAIDDAQGAAAAMAETQLDNLAGDITLFQSALEGAQITLSDKLTPSLRRFVQFGTGEIGKLDKAFQTGGINGFAQQLGASLGDAVGLVSDFVPQFVSVALTAAGAVFKSLFDKLKSEFPNILQFVGEQFVKIGDALMTALPSILSGLGDMIGQLIANTPRLIAFGLEMLAKIAIGILQGIPDFVANVARGFVGIFEEPISGEVAAAQAHLDELKKKVQETTDSIQNGLSEGLGSIDAKVGAAQKWIEIFDELSQKTSLTKEEQFKLNGAVEALNSLFPELGLQIDEETGKWSLNTDEIKKNIDMMARRAKAEVYLDKAKELLGKIVDLEEERSTAQRKLRDAEARQKALNDQYLKAEGLISDLNNEYAKVVRGEETLANLNFSEPVKEWAAQNGIALTTTQGVGKAMSLLSAESSKLKKQYDDASAAALQYAAEVGILGVAIEGYQSKTEELFDKASEYERAAEIVAAAIPKGMDKGINSGTETVTSSATRLRDRSISILNDPKGAEQGGRKLTDAYNSGIESGKPSVKGKASEIVTNAVDGVKQADSSGIGKSGKDVPQEYMNAISEKLPKVKEAGKSVTKSAVDGVKEGDPRKSGRDAGREIDLGVVEGINDKKESVKNAGKSVITELRQTMRDTALIKSPSKLFKKDVGVYIGEGVIEGVDESLRGLYDVLDSRIGSAITAEQQTLSNMEGVSGAELEAINANRSPEYVETTIEIDGRRTAKVISPYVTKEIAWQEE